MFEWLKSSGQSYWNLLKGCFSFIWRLFACVPCCRNDKDATSYEGYQKYNSFRRYFNEIYREKLSNKLIITSAKQSLFSIFVQYLTWQSFWKFYEKSCWRFLSKCGKASSGCESADRSISQYIFIFSANKSDFSCYINSFALSFTIFESELLFFTFWCILQRENI